MNHDRFGEFLFGLAVGCIGGGTFCIWLVAGDWHELRVEAVQRGHAEWVVDQATGKTEWQWKDAK